MDKLDAIHYGICEGLVRRAEQGGRVIDSFLAEWLRHCEAMHESPMKSPSLLLELADIDRHCKNRHGAKELEIERQAFIRHRHQQEGLRAV